MDLSNELTLVSYTYEKDSKGVDRKTQSQRTVFCGVESVSASEFFAANAAGLKPELRFTMFRFDYEGEEECIFEDEYYSIYRTYRVKNDRIELYAQKKVGVNGVQNKTD